MANSTTNHCKTFRFILGSQLCLYIWTAVQCMVACQLTKPVRMAYGTSLHTCTTEKHLHICLSESVDLSAAITLSLLNHDGG